MKRSLVLLLTVLMMLGALATSAMAEAGKLSGEVGVDYASRYIWRGIDLISDNNPGVQPRFSLSYGITDELTVKYLFWADYRLVSGSDRTEENDNDWDEFDHIPSLIYTPNDTWTFELGYIWYYLPSIPNVEEVYVGASMALPHNHYTSLYVYYDFDSDTPDGVYVKLAVGGSQTITDYANCFYSAAIGYMDYDDGFDDGFADLPLTAGISIDLSRGLSASISYNYSFTLDGLDDNGLNDKDEAWLMAGLAYSF